MESNGTMLISLHALFDHDKITLLFSQSFFFASMSKTSLVRFKKISTQYQHMRDRNTITASFDNIIAEYVTKRIKNVSIEEVICGV